MTSGPPTLLRGIDRAAFAVALASRLRTRGVTVGFTAVGDLARAFDVSRPATRSQLYWMTRVCLVHKQGDLPVFDAMFAAIFDDVVLKIDSNGRRKPLGSSRGDDRNVSVPKTADDRGDDGLALPWATLPRVTSDAADSTSDVFVPERLPGRLAGLTEIPFEQLNPADMAQLGAWLRTALRDRPTRRSQRLAIDRSGHRINLRATIARSRRTGWEPVELVCVEPVVKPRRVLMLCDVSQSMQSEAKAYFHLMRALALTAHAEVFAFATTLTRLTGVLGHKSAEVAIEQATSKVVDRFGGTRIATNVAALLASHHADAVRGAIVVIGSDGWDADPPEQLAAAMARLRRRAYRIVWMNPRAAAPGFEPRVAAMAAALQFCDALLPADTFAALAEVIAEIGQSSVSSTASRGSRAGTVRR